MHNSLAEQVKFSLIADIADSTPTSYTEGSYRVDMLGWDNCLFICIVGAITDAPTFKVGESTTSTAGTVTDITGAVCTEVADTTGDQSLVLIDVKRDSISKRYLTIEAIFDADGSSASFWGVIAARYNGNGQVYPLTQVAADLAGDGFKTIQLVKA